VGVIKRTEKKPLCPTDISHKYPSVLRTSPLERKRGERIRRGNECGNAGMKIKKAGIPAF
jgi:hypothetical protein